MKVLVVRYISIDKNEDTSTAFSNSESSKTFTKLPKQIEKVGKKS